MTDDEDDFPKLPSFSLPSGNTVAWCDSCRRWHHHGAGGGHRVAHCGSGRYEDSGYVLNILGPAPREVLADLKRKRQKGISLVQHAPTAA
jgi:hypothetical protein